MISPVIFEDSIPAAARLIPLGSETIVPGEKGSKERSV